MFVFVMPNDFACAQREREREREEERERERENQARSVQAILPRRLGYRVQKNVSRQFNNAEMLTENFVAGFFFLHPASNFAQVAQDLSLS